MGIVVPTICLLPPDFFNYSLCSSIMNQRRIFVKLTSYLVRRTDIEIFIKYRDQNHQALFPTNLDVKSYTSLSERKFVKKIDIIIGPGNSMLYVSEKFQKPFIVFQYGTFDEPTLSQESIQRQKDKYEYAISIKEVESCISTLINRKKTINHNLETASDTFEKLPTIAEFINNEL